MKALAFLLCLLGLATSGCTEPSSTYQGWVEANLIFVGPDEAGRVETLSVREGDWVDKSAPLFTLDTDLQKADLNLNQAAVENATQAFDRAKKLLAAHAGTEKAYQDAEAALRSAQARLETSRTRLARRKMASPVSGTVQQVYFRPGELVAAGRPVIALLPPGNIKVRFFVPEAVLPRISYGETVTVHCDGCRGDISAKVTFIAKSAEYTPPVIYSLQERAKLVFLVEAVPDDPAQLRVGQPVDVALTAQAGRTAHEATR